MQTSDFDYHLPPELIAQHACEPRDAARLLVSVDGQPFAHRHVRDLDGYLRAGDLLVLNRTRVIPARLLARKAQIGDEGGGEREVLLLHPERLRDPSVRIDDHHRDRQCGQQFRRLWPPPRQHHAASRLRHGA